VCDEQKCTVGNDYILKICLSQSLSLLLRCNKVDSIQTQHVFAIGYLHASLSLYLSFKYLSATS
jgi:hypothetical protein